MDFTNSKTTLGAAYPTNAKETTGFERLEPIISPELLKQRHLFGIPLVSAIKDPITGKKQVMTDEILKDYIVGAISEAEAETSTTIAPVTYNERYPFDRQEYLSFGYLRLNHRPVTSIDNFYITTANNMDVFTIPLDWVDVGQLVMGQVNIIPIGIALNGTQFGGGVVTGSGAGAAAFLAIMANCYFIPDYWRILYTAGHKDDMVPRLINDFIGCIAAINVLANLAATYRMTSSSIGADGMSQSVSGPGPNVYQPRITLLEEQRKKLKKQIKRLAGLNLFSGNL